MSDYSTDPEMNAALKADAAKIAALGGDPGPSLQDLGLAPTALSPADAAVVAWMVHQTARIDCLDAPQGQEPCARCLDGMMYEFYPLVALVVAARAETAVRDEALEKVGVECTDGEWGYTSEPHGLQPSSDGTLVEALREQMEVGRAEDAAALATAERARDALKPYLRHWSDCATMKPQIVREGVFPLVCDCGLAAALRAAGGDDA